MNETIPLFPLGTVLFPGALLPLRIFEPRYVDMVSACSRQGSGFGVVLITAGREAGTPAETAPVGTLARIVDFQSLPDGLLGITAQGERRFRILRRSVQPDGLLVADVEYLHEPPPEPVGPAHADLADLLRSALEQLGPPFQSLSADLGDAAQLGYVLAGLLPVVPAVRQRLLQLDDPQERLEILDRIINTSQVSGEEDGDGGEQDEDGEDDGRGPGGGILPS